MSRAEFGIIPWRLGATQSLTAGATSAQSTAVAATTFAIMLTCETANVRVAVGGNPTATATSTLLKTTDGPLIVRCNGSDKVAVIQDTAGGVLGITELSH